MAEYPPARQPGAGQAVPGPDGDLAVPGQPDADVGWLREAIELSRRCPVSATAFSVGAVLVSKPGAVIATGYSRELDPKDHAEEVALARAIQAARAGLQGCGAGLSVSSGGPPPQGSTSLLLAEATLYSSLEPCLHRASRSRSCAEQIIEAGIGRVVIAWLEPPLFAEGGGAEALRRSGVTVIEIPWLAELARSVNAHLLPG